MTVTPEAEPVSRRVPHLGDPRHVVFGKRAFYSVYRTRRPETIATTIAFSLLPIMLGSEATGTAETGHSHALRSKRSCTADRGGMLRSTLRGFSRSLRASLAHLRSSSWPNVL